MTWGPPKHCQEMSGFLEKSPVFSGCPLALWPQEIPWAPEQASLDTKALSHPGFTCRIYFLLDGGHRHITSLFCASVSSPCLK